MTDFLKLLLLLYYVISKVLYIQADTCFLFLLIFWKGKDYNYDNGMFIYWFKADNDKIRNT